MIDTMPLTSPARTPYQAFRGDIEHAPLDVHELRIG